MPQMVTAQELALRDTVGARDFILGMRLATKGQAEVTHQDGPEIVGRVTDGGDCYGVRVHTYRGWDDLVSTFDVGCSCPEARCPHGVALLIAALRGASENELRPAWERALDILGPQVLTGGSAEFGLQFDLALPDGSTASARQVTSPEIVLRPVTRGKTGNWVKQGASWSNVLRPGPGARAVPDDVKRLTREVLALSGSSFEGYYYAEPTVRLELITSRRIWDLLQEAREIGMPLIRSTARASADPSPVHLHDGLLHASLRLEPDGEGIRLAPVLSLDDAPPELTGPEAGLLVALGFPAYGIAWWGPRSVRGSARSSVTWAASERELHLARLAAPLPGDVLKLLQHGALEIPADDRDRFLDDYYPKVRRRLPVQADPRLDLPEVMPPTLRLILIRQPGHRLSFEWSWIYRVGRRKQLFRLSGAEPERDLAAEQVMLARLTAWPADLRATDGTLIPEATLTGMAVVRFLSDVVPGLRKVEGLELIVEIEDDDETEYLEFEDEPEITFVDQDVEGERDWFDLSVSVRVGDEVVPFDELFTALAEGREYLLLASGTYFGLDREEFRQLAALIAEARGLSERSDDGVVRLGRFQAGLWGELERIGVVAGQAAEWQRSVSALRDVAGIVQHPVPAGVEAELRPYQVEGFRWLATLHELGLGGVLADDMGLGKTLQTLALIVHVRQIDPGGGPFLVVAPTSVASNWASEAARFAPGLRVALVSETQARRRSKLSEVVEGADLVITSYTLFRLEYGEYEALSWSGLLLDEAQLVKNHQGRGYQCARRLPVPFKLAITGTPMENNLMELWALTSISAPGLLGPPGWFTDTYRHPIERDRNLDQLDRLRRRIKPLMLRRTKEQVASDLPPKQEQILELELNPRHRKAYQTYLQRERQKVLGLLEDLQMNRFEIFRSLTLLRQASLDVTLIDPELHAGVSATKLDELMDLVAEVAREGHRTLVFSQFTRFLDGARSRLEAAGLEYCYLDGKTRNRGEVIDGFKSGAAPVFLISLKAGGFGLNLTEADYVVMLDPWWNPAAEAQAVDRTHRIGQTKSVMVYRMVARDTIEEKVMALKAEKSALFGSVLDGGGFESAALTAEDIRGLLG